jgi:hypothetical protein
LQLSNGLYQSGIFAWASGSGSLFSPKSYLTIGAEIFVMRVRHESLRRAVGIEHYAGRHEVATREDGWRHKPPYGRHATMPGFHSLNRAILRPDSTRI